MLRRVSALGLLGCLVVLGACGGDDGDQEDAPVPGDEGSAGTAQAQAFAILQGDDTVLVERFTLTGDRVTGVMLDPRGASIEYQAVHAGDDRSMRITQRPSSPQVGPPIVWNFTLRGDSAFFETTRGDSTVRIGDAIQPGTLPHMSPSVGMMALAALTARSMVGDSGQTPLLVASITQPPVVVSPLIQWRADTAWVIGDQMNQFKLVFASGQLVSAENGPQQMRAVPVDAAAAARQPAPATQPPSASPQTGAPTAQPSAAPATQR